MTKYISKIAILFAFVFALAGCSQGDNETATSSSQQKTQTNSTETKTTSQSSSYTGPVSASEYFSDMKGDFVVEFLWLGCSHCQDIEPFVINAKNDHPRVEIVKIPTIFNERWAMDAKVFYATKELGLNSTELLNYYKTVRLGTNQLPTLDDIALFVESKGYSKEEFLTLMDSEMVSNKVEQASALTKEFNIQGTPTFVVNGTDVVSNEGVTSYQGLVDKAFSNF